MSLKRRLENQYQQFTYAVKTIALPAWIDNSLVKVGLIGVVALFGVLYLLQTSATAAHGYEIHSLEKQVDAMASEVQKVEIAIAEESAMPNIERRLSAINMVKVEKINFAAPVGGSVALR